MPQFTPGATKVAGLSIPVSPAGVNCDAELYLTLDGVTKAATSGLKPFTSTGSAQDIQLPITLPSMQGTYMARVLINSGEAQLGAYQAVDNVVIAPLINALNIGGMLIVNNVNGQAFSSFGVDADGIPYGRLATPRVLSSPLTKLRYPGYPGYGSILAFEPIDMNIDYIGTAWDGYIYSAIWFGCAFLASGQEMPYWSLFGAIAPPPYGAAYGTPFEWPVPFNATIVISGESIITNPPGPGAYDLLINALFASNTNMDEFGRFRVKNAVIVT